MASQNRRFRKEDVQKDLDRLQNSLDDCTLDRKFGKAREELDVDKMHVCGGFMCTFNMNYWRNQWLLRDGYVRLWREGIEDTWEWENLPDKQKKRSLELAKSLGYSVRERGRAKKSMDD